ncbi:galactosyltransferase-domain-containing protein [Piptocephalis cylindrospora]|uniref:Galactosyltransferase-domain-containing protein n=1 Tax=Piptocephalis cylindrospora TaxID=1907219 RepID=A0A4P9Y1J9_9FUNG|nr:galactosyltransferase-domain-containing protein [Piptocephalis cylindrospora]|eukprot:RKP11690.1 galactosyltransferase-domain-containing protein [Piptocephalis cylindrospora]
MNPTRRRPGDVESATSGGTRQKPSPEPRISVMVDSASSTASPSTPPPSMRAFRQIGTVWDLAPVQGNEDVANYHEYAHHYRLALWSILVVILASSVHHVWLALRIPKTFPPSSWPTLAAKALPVALVLWITDQFLIPCTMLSPMNQRVLLSLLLLGLYVLGHRKIIQLHKPTTSRQVDLHALPRSLQSSSSSDAVYGLSSPMTLWIILILTSMLTLMGALSEQTVMRSHRDASVRITDLDNTPPFSSPLSSANSSKQPIRILVLVLSSWSERSVVKRKTFRETSLVLANRTQAHGPTSHSSLFPSLPSIQVEHRFILGIPPSTKVRRGKAGEIEKESVKYGDILLVPTSDRYEDLSRKLYAGLEWATESGNSSSSPAWDYLVKTDDDVFVRLDTLSTELARLHPQPGLWQGQAWWDIPPILEKDSRNAVVDYGLSLFPPYTSGALTILSRDVVDRVVQAGPIRRYTRNEDQTLGIWLYPLGYRPKNDRRIQQEEVCEEDMLAKHFADRFSPSPGPYGMLDNIIKGEHGMCHGFRQDLCAPCYPCAPGTHHYHEWNFACDPIRGITLLKPIVSATSNLAIDDAPNDFVHEMMAPSEWAMLGDEDEKGERPANLVWIIWWNREGDQGDWGKREIQSVASLLFHQPDARIRILSPHLSSTSIPQTWADSGYDVRVVWPRTPKEAEEALTSAGPASRQWYLQHIFEEGEGKGGGVHHPKAISLFLIFAIAYRHGGIFFTPETLGWTRSLMDGWSKEERIALYPSVPKNADRGGEEIKGLVMALNPQHPYIREILETSYTLQGAGTPSMDSAFSLELDPSGPLRQLTQYILGPDKDGMDNERAIILEGESPGEKTPLSDATIYLPTTVASMDKWFPAESAKYLSSPTKTSFLGPSSLDLSSFSLSLIKEDLHPTTGVIPLVGVTLATRWTGPACPPSSALYVRLQGGASGNVQGTGRGK